MKSLKNVFKVSALLFTFSLLVFTSCNKSDDTTNDIDVTNDAELKMATAIDQTIATAAFDEITDITDEAIHNFDEILASSQLKDGGNGNHRGHSFKNRWHYDTITLQGRNLLRLSECATIIREINEAKDSMLMVIDFGSENCLAEDGRERRGKIMITRYGNHYWDGAFEVNHTFDNYFVDNNQVVGTKIVSGFINAAGLRVQNMIDNGSIILANAGGTIIWSAERNREVVEGSDTRIKLDDVIHITGNSSGSDADGNTFSSVISQALVRIHELGCFRHPVSGIVNITRSPDTEITIDFGDGTCDNLAEVTTNGVTETIELGTNRRI